jgi:hypothetical protein
VARGENLAKGGGGAVAAAMGGDGEVCMAGWYGWDRR